MRNSRPLMILLGALAAIVALLVTSASAQAARNLDYGFVEDQFADNLLTNSNPSIANEWWNKAKGTNSDVMRINLYWSQTVGQSPPANPTNPADPAYNWSIPDAAVRNAKARGIDVVFTVFLAPRWAEGPNRPASEDVSRIGTWKPNPVAYGQFAEAVARRYSGKFGGLPKVKYFEAWNEPNLPQYLTPQWDGKKPVAPDTYRDLLNSFYFGIKKGNKKAKVVTAGTSPFGDNPGGKRMRPYYFWREVFCLKHNKKLKKNKKCKKQEGKTSFDVYAHNPINAVKGKGPLAKSPHPDDGVPSNFKTLTKIVKKGVKQKTIGGKKKKQGWGTETWYESRPPEKKAVSLKKQAQFMQQALYVLWKQKAKTVFFLQLRDSPYDPSLPPLVGFQTGVYLPNDKPKPSLKAVQFPFVADRKSKKKVLLWGIAPKGGKVTIKDGKKKLKKVKAKKSKVFTTKVKLKKSKKKHKLQAKVGKNKSLVWKQK